MSETKEAFEFAVRAWKQAYRVVVRVLLRAVFLLAPIAVVAGIGYAIWRGPSPLFEAISLKVVGNPAFIPCIILGMVFALAAVQRRSRVLGIIAAVCMAGIFVSVAVVELFRHHCPAGMHWHNEWGYCVMN